MKYIVALFIVFVCACVQTFQLHVYGQSVVYDPRSSFSHVYGSPWWLTGLLVLMALGLIRFGGIGGAIAAGGVISNVLLVTCYGVVDYVHFGGEIFNLADVCVLIGVLMIAGQLLLSRLRYS